MTAHSWVQFIVLLCEDDLMSYELFHILYIKNHVIYRMYPTIIVAIFAFFYRGEFEWFRTR